MYYHIGRNLWKKLLIPLKAQTVIILILTGDEKYIL